MVILDGDPLSKKGGVTGRIYLEMLQEQLPTLLDDDSIFMQDNAPIHTYKQVTNWFQDMGIMVMEWPPYSPDLNPIEHSWFPLKENAHMVQDKYLDTVEGKEQIKKALREVLPDAWEAIPDKRFKNLIASMKKRCEAVIKADGWWTKY